MENISPIQVRNLSVYFGKTQALDNINVDIPKKKITVIIGPSGCGKTTLLKSFNRLIDINTDVTISGEVNVDGININDSRVNPVHIRKKMGLLAQRPCPLPMSIFDNIAFGPRIHGTRNKKELNGIVRLYLTKANLWDEVKDRLYEPASMLSIGQQQRLCLARGLAVEPEIILGDEPTSALDPQSSTRIEQLFLSLKENYTIVLVTHILRQAKRLADYVLFLYCGKLIEYGSASDVFNNPKEEMTKKYISGVIS